MLSNFPFINLIMTGILIPVIFIKLSGYSESIKDDYGTNIVCEQRNSQLIVKGIFNNNSIAEINIVYNLAVNKKSKSGNSSTNQSGKLLIPMKTKTTLSSCIVDFSGDAVYQIHLLIRCKGIILSEKELELKGSEILKELNIKVEKKC